VPANSGAPPDWRPATTPSGQSWPPSDHGHWPTHQVPPPQAWHPPANGGVGPGSNGNGEHPGPDAPRDDAGGPSEDRSR
jgi:cell division protease FtsH